jgi:hypothetical protein
MLTDKELILQLEVRSDLTALETEMLARLVALVDAADEHERAVAEAKTYNDDALAEQACTIKSLEDDVKYLREEVQELEHQLDQYM